MQLVIHVHHYVHQDGSKSDETSETLGRIEAITRQLFEAQTMATQELERLRSEVEQSRTVMQSAETAITGLAAEVRRLRDDPAALDALANSLDTSANALAAAVAANTVAEDEAGDGTGDGTGGGDGTGDGGGTGDGTGGGEPLLNPTRR